MRPGTTDLDIANFTNPTWLRSVTKRQLAAICRSFSFARYSSLKKEQLVAVMSSFFFVEHEGTVKPVWKIMQNSGFRILDEISHGFHCILDTLCMVREAMDSVELTKLSIKQIDKAMTEAVEREADLQNYMVVEGESRVLLEIVIDKIGSNPFYERDFRHILAAELELECAAFFDHPKWGAELVRQTALDNMWFMKELGMHRQHWNSIYHFVGDEEVASDVLKEIKKFLG